MSRRTRLAAAALVFATSFVLPMPALSHTPTAGSDELYTPNQSLLWAFGGSYSSWLTTPAEIALDVNHQDPATNNSKSPMFQRQPGGDGDVIYSGQSLSPCGTGNPDWLQCANGGGTTTWNIYVRNFTAAPHGSWTWYDKTGSCAGGDTCWYIRRAIILEALHVTLGAAHDSQGESNTVMASVTPWYNNTGWNTVTLRRCDESAAQLAYDVRDWAGPYGNCFDHIPDHGTSGLRTDMTTVGSSFHACNGQAILVTGRLQIKDLDGYKKMGGNPLGNRTVWFDRGATVKFTSTTAGSVSMGPNWSKSFGGSNVSYTFTVHFDDTSTDGLDDSNKPTFTASWSSAC